MEEPPPTPPTEPGSASGPAEGALPPAPPTAPPPDARTEPAIPWEQPGLGLVSAFAQTIGLLVSSPRRAFERMPVTSAFGRPLVFGILLGWFGILAQTSWDILLEDARKGWFPWASEDGVVSRAVAIGLALSAPLWVPIFLLVAAAIQHLFLILVDGARRGFAATFRTLLYAQTASLLYAVPLCGGILGFVWGVVLTVIGLSAAHRITTGRSALAVLLPMILCLGCAALGLALFGAAIFARLRE